MYLTNYDHPNLGIILVVCLSVRERVCFWDELLPLVPLIYLNDTADYYYYLYGWLPAITYEYITELTDFD